MNRPRQDDDEAREAAALTLAEYDRMAEAYRHGTADHDVSQNIAALLEAIEGEAPYAILDLGCGPGRDLRAFTALGHEVTGLDGSAALVALARAETDCDVLHQDFLALDLPPARFDGVFANAALFHVPSSEIARVLADLAAALKPGGVLFCSNPRGANEEGWVGGRYGCFYDLETWRALVTGAGELHHYYRPPGRPRQEQPWLATVWRKGYRTPARAGVRYRIKQAAQLARRTRSWADGSPTPLRLRSICTRRTSGPNHSPPCARRRPKAPIRPAN